MKGVRELLDWCEGAEREFGDASVPIGLMFVRLGHEGVGAELIDQDLTARADGVVLTLKLFGDDVDLPISNDGPCIEDGSLVAFGIRQVQAGLWHLTPSLNLPGVLHAFVVLYDVPSPAPWERLIYIPGGRL